MCSHVFQAKCDKEKGDLQTEKEKLARKFLKFFKGKKTSRMPKMLKVDNFSDIFQIICRMFIFALCSDVIKDVK